MSSVRDSVPVRLSREQVPGPRRERTAPGDEVRLQLSVSKQGLGLELCAPARIDGVLAIDELSVRLPGIGFPVDLSGGVPRFRHRRGVLRRLSLTLSRDTVTGHLARQAAPVFGEAPLVTVLPRRTSALIGVATHERALAFELFWAPTGRDGGLVVTHARAMHVDATAHGLALTLVEAWLRGVATRQGSFFRLEDAAARLLRDLLPRAGARVPSTEGLVWGPADASVEGFRVSAEEQGRPAAVDEEAARALELCELARSADDALATGDADLARARYLDALERAPHQPELCRRLADLDRAARDRAEAALSTLVTAMPATAAGALGGALLEAIGDVDGARVAYERGAEEEPVASLSALMLAASSRLASHPAERAALLDQALARAPTLPQLRRAQLEALVDLGDTRGALAQIEHLEAMARGPDAKQKELVFAGKALHGRGLAALAVQTLERALRYAPSEADVLLALGIALHRSGEPSRAADVLGRASALCDRRHEVRHDVEIAMAEALGDGLGDLSLAIARLRAVPITSPFSPRARFLEGRYLARLGDLAEASLAFARLRDAIEQAGEGHAADAAAWLSEAAAFERDERRDLASAKRHLGVALRRRPRDQRLLDEFRDVARELEASLSPAPTRAAPVPSPPVPSPALAPLAPPATARPSAEPISEPPSEPPPSDRPTPVQPDASDQALTLMPPPVHEDAHDEPEAKTPQPPPALEPDPEDELLAEQLADRVRADPTNLEVVLDLAGALERLGRDMELFALLSARLEEVDDDTRSMLMPLQRAVLGRLADAARRDGRSLEAELYEQMRDGLS